MTGSDPVRRSPRRSPTEGGKRELEISEEVEIWKYPNPKSFPQSVVEDGSRCIMCKSRKTRYTRESVDKLRRVHHTFVGVKHLLTHTPTQGHFEKNVCDFKLNESTQYFIIIKKLVNFHIFGRNRTLTIVLSTIRSKPSI